MSDRIEAEILDALGEEVDAAVDTPLIVIEGTKGDPGKDGITPTIGDNGNWYLSATDTGKPSRGETGAQGTPGIYYGATQPTGDTHPVWIDPDGDHDDGGLLPAVTAADNGKVLRVAGGAWSPVDMPSGGGGETWELIRDFTLAEDVVQVTINLDENGKPFSLKKAYVFITATAPTDESITYAADICCSPAKESPSVWGTNTVFVGQSPAFGQSTRYTMSLWDTYGNFLLPVEIKSSNGNSTADRLVTKTSYDAAGAIVATDSGLGFLQSPCESFAFGSYRKTLFTGANIKIYGVRV